MTVSGAPIASDIELRGVTLDFPRPDGDGRLTIYQNLNLTIAQGSFTVLLGPSGCGKSTLLNVIDGLITPSKADAISVLGRDVRTDREVTRQVGYVFQSPRLLRWKTLRQNAEFGLRGLAIQPKERWPALIERYFGVVGLSDYLDYYPHQVSGGMQQRAAIIRAWVNEPRILLMDEPFSHLDEITAYDLRQELVRLWRQDDERRTIVFVTHDINEAVVLGDRIIMMTPRPAEICYSRDIDLPWPREGTDVDVFRLEQELRQVFAERAGVRT
jgi:NitT/TauT family transport system ATP-binding protein